MHIIAQTWENSLEQHQLAYTPRANAHSTSWSLSHIRFFNQAHAHTHTHWQPSTRLEEKREGKAQRAAPALSPLSFATSRDSKKKLTNARSKLSWPLARASSSGTPARFIRTFAEIFSPYTPEERERMGAFTRSGDSYRFISIQRACTHTHTHTHTHTCIYTECASALSRCLPKPFLHDAYISHRLLRIPGGSSLRLPYGTVVAIRASFRFMSYSRGQYKVHIYACGCEDKTFWSEFPKSRVVFENEDLYGESQSSNPKSVLWCDLFFHTSEMKEWGRERGTLMSVMNIRSLVYSHGRTNVGRCLFYSRVVIWFSWICLRENATALTYTRALSRIDDESVEAQCAAYYWFDFYARAPARGLRRCSALSLEWRAD